MNLKIRPISTNDQLQVILILNKAFNTPKSLTLNEDYIADQNIYSFISEVDKKIVGTASLHIVNKINRKVGLIEDVAILPSHRGKGIGLKLIKQRINKCKKLNLQLLTDFLIRKKSKKCLTLYQMNMIF